MKDDSAVLMVVLLGLTVAALASASVAAIAGVLAHREGASLSASAGRAGTAFAVSLTLLVLLGGVLESAL